MQRTTFCTWARDLSSPPLADSGVYGGVTMTCKPVRSRHRRQSDLLQKFGGADLILSHHPDHDGGPSPFARQPATKSIAH